MMKPNLPKKKKKCFSKKEVVLYLQPLQLLQILEGTSLDDADLVVFQVPRNTEAAMVKDKRNLGIPRLDCRPCRHGHSASATTHETPPQAGSVWWDKITHIPAWCHGNQGFAACTLLPDRLVSMPLF